MSQKVRQTSESRIERFKRVYDRADTIADAARQLDVNYSVLRDTLVSEGYHEPKDRAHDSLQDLDVDELDHFDSRAGSRRDQ